MPSSITRDAIVAEARQWIGTPYRHQASCRGAGADCIGLVRGVWRALYGSEPEAVPSYTRDWAEATGSETLVAAARRHLVAIAAPEARPGDVLVFRYRPRAIAKHIGIVGTAITAPSGEVSSTLIHAVEGAPVSEVPIGAWWRRRIVAAFSFPGLVH